MADFFLNSNGSGKLSFILLTAVIGIVVACIAMLWQIKVPGKLVRKLSAREAVGEDKALSAAELGYTKEWLLRFLLSENTALRKYVGVTGAERDKKGKEILTASSLYLREETKERAELRYNKKNASTGTLIIAIVLFSALAVAMYFIIPDLIKMLENFIGTLKGGIK